MLKPNRSSQLVPLITRLQTWGYDIDAVKPVSKVVDKLDSATLSLIERLVHDLTQLNECSHDLRNEVNNLAVELDYEKQLLDRLRGENQRCLRENSELRAQVRGGEGHSRIECRWSEARISNLWRGTGPTVEDTEHAPASRARDYEPSSTVNSQFPNMCSSISESADAGTDDHFQAPWVAETRCKKMEEELQRLTEGHTTLQEQLASSQLQISSKDREIQELQLANRKHHPNKLLFVGKGISFLRLDLENLASELLSLQKIYERETDVHTLPFSQSALDLPNKHNIDDALRDSDMEQKVKGVICNLDHKEEELVKEINGLDSYQWLDTLDSERTQCRKMLDDARKVKLCTGPSSWHYGLGSCT